VVVVVVLLLLLLLDHVRVVQQGPGVRRDVASRGDLVRLPVVVVVVVVLGKVVGVGLGGRGRVNYATKRLGEI